jgi:hypothetical protein
MTQEALFREAKIRILHVMIETKIEIRDLYIIPNWIKYLRTEDVSSFDTE